MTTRPISHRYLTQAAYTVEPWKNGRGSTDIIAEQRVDNAPGEGWDGFVWRLARTEIAAALPFSDHTGFERHQVVIEGEGLYLDSASGMIDLSRPLKPVQYGGELKIVSRLETGPVKVLNLMVDRRLARGEMIAMTSDATAELPAGTHVAFAVAGVVRIAIEGIEIDIAADDAVVLAATTSVTVNVRRGAVVLSSIYPSRTH